MRPGGHFFVDQFFDELSGRWARRQQSRESRLNDEGARLASLLDRAQCAVWMHAREHACLVGFRESGRGQLGAHGRWRGKERTHRLVNDLDLV